MLDTLHIPDILLVPVVRMDRYWGTASTFLRPLEISTGDAAK